LRYFRGQLIAKGEGVGGINREKGSIGKGKGEGGKGCEGREIVPAVVSKSRRHMVGVYGFETSAQYVIVCKSFLLHRLSMSTIDDLLSVTWIKIKA